MLHGPVPPRRLPEQDGAKVLLLADRYQRAAMAHGTWAAVAKECVDFVEGRQWTEEQLRAMKLAGRPALTFNKIAPLVRLVQGYHSQNALDTTYNPSSDGLGTDAVAQALTAIRKHTSQVSDEPYVDTEVFLDGIVTGRGFYDVRLDYSENDFGEAIVKASNPFTTFIDPDGDQYDPRHWGYCVDSRMMSVDEVGWCYGQAAADLVLPFTRGETPLSPISMVPINGEIQPVRSFGNYEGEFGEWWENLYGMLGDFYDPYRKSIRVLDFQYWVTRQARVMIDLETGDRKVLPDDWSQQKIDKAIWYGAQIGNPVTVENRRVREVRWTTLAGDVIVYDKWSKYDQFTKVGYFPYFRRGQTRGMVSDLLDPQREINKRRSAEIEIVGKSGNSGWSYHKDSLTPEQKRLLQKIGGMPGYNQEWQGENWMKPERISPGVAPTAMEKLEQKAQDDLKVISSLNDSATGELDRVQSGRAVEARQRQAVIGQQIYLTNFSRSKKLVGSRCLSIYQSSYTENRVFRILGEGGKLTETIINQEQIDPSTGLTTVLNDVARGKYSVVIDERPLSATFANGQFEEMIRLIEKFQGALPVGAFADLMIDASSLPRKQEWVQRAQQVIGVQPPGAQPGGGAPGPGGGQTALPPPNPASEAGSNVIPLTR